MKRRLIYLVVAVVILATAVSVSQFLKFKEREGKDDARSKIMHLPGTQPNELTALEPSDKCRQCHDPGYEVAPYPKWRGSMMSQAARDPLFYAALAVAEQDVKGSGDFCLRCHAPQGWLLGRSKPTDGSALLEEDLDGITCDVCHRLIDPLSEEGKQRVKGEPVRRYADGMYVVADDEAKRGALDDTLPPHESKYSAFYSDGDFCGTCHNVTNPLNKQPLERTYSEWRLSWFALQGGAGSCQACHMRSASGFLAEPKLLKAKVPYREDVATHDLTGGSNWIYDALPLVWDGLDLEALQQGKERSLETLQRAAELVLSFEKGDTLSLEVKVINKTGHKLPTGYPEGRRVWLNVKSYDGDGNLIFESGKYDTAKAEIVEDEQLKVYEAKLGIKGEGPTFHFILNNYVVKDNRIPPRGFAAKDFGRAGAGVVGYRYRDGQFWDDTRYELPKNTARIGVSLLYQTSAKAYIDFLAKNNKTDDWGKKLLEVWEKTGKSAPVEMATAQIDIE